MDIQQIQEELNELRQAWVLADRKLEVAQKIAAIEPEVTLTNINIAIETINHIKSRLVSLKEELE